MHVLRRLARLRPTDLLHDVAVEIVGLPAVPRDAEVKEIVDLVIGLLRADLDGLAFGILHKGFFGKREVRLDLSVCRGDRDQLGEDFSGALVATERLENFLGAVAIPALVGLAFAGKALGVAVSEIQLLSRVR